MERPWRGNWRAWAVPALLFVAAAALRLWLVGMPLYGDEAAHYYVARHLGTPPPNVYHADLLPTQLLAARPAFFLLLAPGAQLGFIAFRVENALLGAAIPVLAWALLRQLGARQGVAATAGALLALHPWMAVWGVRVFPDSLMAALVLAGLLLHARGRPVAAALLLALAVWTKETAIVALAAVGAAALWGALRRREAGLWPLRLDRPTTAYLAGGLLAVAPLLLSMLLLGARMPGWATTSMTWADLDHAFLAAWLVVPLLLGLAWRRTRPWSLLGLLLPGFYLAYSLGLGRGVSIWYHVAGAALATVGAFLALDEAWRRAAPQPSRLLRATGRLAPAGVALLLLAPLALTPGAVAQAFAAPAAGLPAADYATLAREATAPDLVLDAARFVQGAPNLFVVDAGWFYVLYPLSTSVHQLGFAYSEFHGDLAAWTKAIEQVANWTVVEKHDIPLNLAIREVYHDCVRHATADYVVIAGKTCAGRDAQLRAALVAHGGSP